jgi:putative ABC transport system substrate-binding protein
MRRREFIALVGSAAFAWPRAARAQRPVREKMARVGIIDDSSTWDPFREQLRHLGHVEGKNIAFEYRSAAGRLDRLQEAASDLVNAAVDVLAVFGTPAARAAQKATAVIPIVAISIGDPIRAGLVPNLARPGANITGNTILGPDVVTKRLQILKEAIPSVSRVAFLWNPDNASNTAIRDEVQIAAPSFGIALVSVEAPGSNEFDAALETIARERPDAVLVTNDPFHQMHAARLIELLLKSRVPGVFQIKENVVAGGLMSYGASLPDLFRRGATYVAKILQGTRPADLPIEQPVTFELAINLKTARVLGIEISPLLLARADEVIE